MFRAKIPKVLRKHPQPDSSVEDVQGIGNKILSIGGMNNWTNRSIDLYAAQLR